LLIRKDSVQYPAWRCYAEFFHLRSGFQRRPGIFFNWASSASPKRVNLIHWWPSVPVSIFRVVMLGAAFAWFLQIQKTAADA
jgi:hypothetical protein